MKIIVRAPAKLNLGLDAIIDSDEKTIQWNMVMTSITLCDYVSLEITNDHKISVLSDSGFLPEDNHNLAYQAAKIFFATSGIKSGVNIEIEKHIPVAAGLGGGSSDAAAVLRGLNQIFKTGYSLEKLALMGLKIDADVPYCVYGKTAHMTGKGEIIKPLGSLPSMWLVLAKPNISVSTPRVVRQLFKQEVDHPDIDALLDAVRKGSLQGIVNNLGNSLETITSTRNRQVQIIKERLVKYGADGALMTGSGPTVFGICRQQSRAKRVYNSISGFCDEVYLVQIMKGTFGYNPKESLTL
ncbi:4-(cytidine 5'-diphospho)-2-C-methyl-D-erythritol kinase [Lentilactobacillus sp. Marseille-Q4993]|uniref:4-(cytidine 5'-diphospho)-2-C-methyl-D-erythritol kinase n=1 Tax=Lentilactobacillus sp. Marseille-Q4993 TaxID=3039492 RepID=UPI0024BC78B9|nr:4-(cytidine 5'-diphospho)-2-C-methyl-D-erythritol kinase [Lentilactobacillus sp. Marseille-Q4993]